MTDRSIFYAGLTLAERFKDLSTRTMWHHQMQEISVCLTAQNLGIVALVQNCFSHTLAL